MNIRKLYRLVAILLCSTSLTSAHAQQLAFPEAQGWGRFATGGRTGSVYHVTNLNDSGAGSLRDAVSQPNRIVVFDVAGVIQLQSRLVFSKNLYIAGQTAPGEGIIVYGDAVSFSGASNSIVRYMKFRMGKGGASGKDALGVANGTNMIFDHCSVSWGLDETFSISWDNKGTAPADITISNCIIGQGLLTHSAGGLIQADRITLYRNFYCDNDTRNNKIKGINQYVNCLVYNWRSGCYLMGGDSEGSSYVNATNNLFINGPAGGGNAMTGANDKYHIYAEDNWQDRNADGKFDPYEIPRSEYSGGPTFMTKPYDYPELPAWKATQLVDSLLPEVGASLPYRDLADYYMVHQVRSFGTEGGIISSEAQLPFGTPTNWGLKTFGKPTDTDKDGMPDEWESANGLNPNANDAMTIASNGYANIENYINSLTIKNRTPFLRTPVLFAYQSSTDNTITLEWLDFTDSEEGFILEVQTDGSWNEYARIPNGVVELKGTIMMIYWQTNGDLHIGGLKGTASTTLGGSSKQTAGHKMTWRIGGANTNETFQGVINDCASNTADKYKGTTNIVKEGSGDWRLSGTNIYTGTTIVEGGRLIVNGTHNGGGTYTVKDGATLMGRGTIGSRVTVQDGGTVFAGDTTIRSTYALKLNAGLTVSRGGQVEFPILYNGTSATNSRISITGSFVVNGGTLVLNLDKAPELPDGTELRLFSKLGTVSGTGFTTIIPEQPSPTQIWDTSTLLTDGYIRVLNKEEALSIDGITPDGQSSEPQYDLNGRPAPSDYRGIIVKGKKKILRK